MRAPQRRPPNQMNMSKDKVTKQSNIKIQVGLNADQVPVRIHWEAEDNPHMDGPQQCKAFMLSLFDDEHKDTLKVDLWTKDMQIFEMDRFFYQTMRAMTDTYYRATQNKELAQEMARFVQYFGERTEIIPKEK